MNNKLTDLSPPIRFTKMHALGNDFVVINDIEQTLILGEIAITHLANRHTGIGFDQLLIVEPSTRADYFCRIYNADGSVAEQCGNGLRCIARFLHEEKLIQHSPLTIETKSGIYSLIIHDYEHIEVAMGQPTIQESLLDLTLSDCVIPITVISIGNPHAILKVTSVDAMVIEPLAREISTHSLFPKGANVGFMEVVDAQHIHLRTFERGVGETHACGSNACAAAIAGIENGWLDHKVNVEFRYGTVQIEWHDERIIMTGPASSVFSGEITDKR